MYLSQIRLDRGQPQARADLANPYSLHATLCRAFAEEDQAPPRFLWRAEDDKTPRVLVQSTEEPDWGRLAQRFPGYFCEPPKTGQLPLEHLQPGQILRFRLRCNPTVTKQGKRHGLSRLEDLIGFETPQGEWKPGWLERQSYKGGFGLMGYMVAQSDKVKMLKHRGGSPITLQSVLYEGHLRITDLELFKQTLRSGLGHAKALGFGLLSIAKG